MRQLDGIRGLAIIGVFMNHFGQVSWSVSCGWMGVSLFFVLSGFLITRILLMQKSVMSGAGGGLWRTLGIFYARRSLRIFPLYYGIVVIACYWNLNQAGSVKWPLATYTYNMVLASDNNIGPGHLWSLCVEEQFYLVWPALILLCPPRILPWMIATVLIMGPL
ncbi:MAG: acyltransferase family protein [Planctomycetota bacterium]